MYKGLPTLESIFIRLFRHLLASPKSPSLIKLSLIMIFAGFRSLFFIYVLPMNNSLSNETQKAVTYLC